jgi:MraZ protein
MFIGASKVSLDSKGRLAIPTRHRERIIARGDGHLVATIDRDHCLLLYPQPDWEEIARQLVRLPGLKKQARRLQRLMLGHATEIEMDGHGRVLLPAVLREFAGLERQVMLIGQGHKFEVWDEQRWLDSCTGWLDRDDDDAAGLEDELKSFPL